MVHIARQRVLNTLAGRERAVVQSDVVSVWLTLAERAMSPGKHGHGDSIAAAARTEQCTQAK